MRIISDDGKEFRTIDDCKAYEEKLRAERERRAELKATQQKRIQEMFEAYKKAEDLMNQYQEDYSPLTILTRVRF